MIDVICVVSTIAFFVLMLAFVHGLERLGEGGGPDGREPS